MTNEAIDDGMEEFDMDNEYMRSIQIKPAVGGYTAVYYDYNPNYKRMKRDEEYDSRIHTKTIHRTRIFTDAKAVIEWLNERINKG